MKTFGFAGNNVNVFTLSLHLFIWEMNFPVIADFVVKPHSREKVKETLLLVQQVQPVITHCNIHINRQ